MNLFNLEMKVSITKTFVSATIRDLDKNFVALFEKEARNPIKYHLLVDLSENCLLYDK